MILDLLTNIKGIDRFFLDRFNKKDLTIDNADDIIYA